MEEQSNEIMQVSELEQMLSVELTKIDKLQPLYPIDEEKVNMIDTTDQKKQIILAAHNYPRVHQYPKMAQRYRLLIAINKTIMFVGHNVQDPIFLYNGVLEYVRLHGKHLTMEELEIAFKRGAMDEYGEWHGLSAMTFCKWIKGYVNSTKLAAMKEKAKIEKMEREKEEERTPEEKLQSRKDWLNGILDKYDEFLKDDKEKMELYDFMNRLFIFLFKIDILKISNKEGGEFVNRAKHRLRGRTKRRLEESDVQREAKNIALEDFLISAKKKKLDLRKLIKDNKGWKFLETWED
jgi:hypothetical protein